MRANMLLSAMALMAASTAQADYLFTTQFNSGRIPAIMSASAEDSPAVVSKDYRQGVDNKGKGWAVTMVSMESSYAAVCATHTQTATPMNCVLTCPQVTITGERPMLRWKACSIHPSMPEAYRVSVLEEGATEPAVVYNTEAAPAEWEEYAVDLSEWNGKNVTISFTCVSVNKYMLAIDDIYVGDPEEVRTSCVITSPAYVGNESGTASVTGRVSNFGMPLKDAVLVLRHGEEELSTPLPETWSCGETHEFEFAVPVSLNEYTEYTIGVESASTEFTAVAEGKVFCSHYARTLLVDEFTGMWCNNCPKGQLELDKLHKRFGSNVIDLGVHINDVFECTEYREGHQVYSVPYMMLNRDPETQGETIRGFEAAYAAPTPAKIEILSYSIEGDLMQVKTRTYWAEEMDNSGDRYRVAYTLTRDIHTDSDTRAIYQSNSMSGVASGRFNILPPDIPSDLVYLDNVVLDGEFSHSGRPYTLPGKMSAGEHFDSEFSVHKPIVADNIPAEVSEYELKDCRLVAYIVDTTNGKVLNAVEQYLDRPVDTSSVDGIETADPDNINAAPEYYNLQGLRVAAPGQGIYIKRQGSKVSKVLIP